MVSNGSRNGHELVLGDQIDETETEGIEVAMVCEGSCRRLEVRLIRWGPGIGWYVQKRISFGSGGDCRFSVLPRLDHPSGRPSRCACRPSAGLVVRQHLCPGLG